MASAVSRRAASGVVGASDHYGWAVLVAVADDGAFRDRRRVVLVDDALPKCPYHHDAQGLPDKEAIRLVERVRVSAERHAKLALEAAAAEMPVRVRGLVLRRCPPLPATIPERIRDYRAQCVADSVMYRMALAGAAEARGWTVHWYEAKTVLDAARAALGVRDMELHFARLRESLGPPWNNDHRLAMAGAIVAAKARRK